MYVNNALQSSHKDSSMALKCDKGKDILLQELPGKEAKDKS